MTIYQRIVRRVSIIKDKIAEVLRNRMLKRNGLMAQENFSIVKKTIEKKIDKNETIEVGFIGYQEASSCDVFTSIYRAFMKDTRFNLTVVIAPYTHDSKDEMIRRLRNSEEYLTKKGVPFIKGYDEQNDMYLDYGNCFDIVFFEMEYEWLRNEFKAHNFKNALSFLTPYGEYLADNIISSHFSNSMMYDLYKVIPPGKNVYDMMCKASFIGDRNIYPFMGNAKLDSFFDENYQVIDVWKKQGSNKKRVIWAPHHIWANYSNFLLYKDFMVELARKYEEEIQFAFKPHPALAASLLEIGGWSQEEINEYYELWNTMPNTQYEGQEWIDLFLSSDAMILDSIAFMAEYSLSGKPACVLYRETKDLCREMGFSECGEEIYNRLYHAKSQGEVLEFIEKVVLDNNDFMKDERVNYIMSQYRPPLTGNAGENIYRQICEEIGIDFLSDVG